MKTIALAHSNQVGFGKVPLLSSGWERVHLHIDDLIDVATGHGLIVSLKPEAGLGQDMELRMSFTRQPAPLG